MSKEVEALERIETTFSLNKQGKESAYRGYTNSVYPYYEDFDLVLNALKRLEAIDNANPSEAFNYLDIFINEMTYCLEHPKEYAKGYNKEIFYKYKYTFETTIKQALIKAQEQEKENEILREIIKSFFYKGCPLHQYTDKKGILQIEVDDECSIIHLGKYKGIDLDKYLKEVIENV